MKGTQTPPAQLTALGDEYFVAVQMADPFTATQLGVAGFDGLIPDPSRDGAARNVRVLTRIENRLGRIDADQLDEAGAINHAVLAHLAAGARSDLEHGLWEANASAGGYVSPQAMVFQSMPTALFTGQPAIRDYLDRMRRLPGYFDAITRRFQQAIADGRFSTEVGVRQAISQLEGHLARPISADTLATVPLPEDLDSPHTRAQMASLMGKWVRPAMKRLLACLRDELLPVARPDDEVGIRFVPGGEVGYAAAVRRHTSTDLTPEQIHQIGLDTLAGLKEEWAELGGRVLGTSDVPEILRRLREDKTLRFTSSAEIVATVTDALARAEEARGDWFPAYDIPACVVEEIDPVESGNSALAYYRPPAGGGLRPGAHCILTSDPELRFSHEYEALAFHESTPGHHLQLASAQTLTGLPDFRRFLDAEVCGYVEGWGLYCERLADEMGLYTSDLRRLGMLSFDALRACRLVVDTGMHHFGWSRSAAADFMWENTATTRANIDNEVDRYITWPGQALAYMIGRREIQRLRDVAEQKLGARFDIQGFHGTVLGNGAVPLGVLGQLVTRWADAEGERA